MGRAWIALAAKGGDCGQMGGEVDWQISEKMHLSLTSRACFPFLLSMPAPFDCCLAGTTWCAPALHAQEQQRGKFRGNREKRRQWKQVSWELIGMDQRIKQHGWCHDRHLLQTTYLSLLPTCFTDELILPQSWDTELTFAAGLRHNQTDASAPLLLSHIDVKFNHGSL